MNKFGNLFGETLGADGMLKYLFFLLHKEFWMIDLQLSKIICLSPPRCLYCLCGFSRFACWESEIIDK